MCPADSNRIRLPKGVSELRRPRGGRRFRASIRRGKGVEVHLGLYSSIWLASFAYGIAARLTGHSEPHLEIPQSEQPDSDQVREITGRVRKRLGFDSPSRHLVEIPPDPDELLTLFEITVVGFWRDQGDHDGNDYPGAGPSNSKPWKSGFASRHYLSRHR